MFRMMKIQMFLKIKQGLRDDFTPSEDTISQNRK